MQIYLENLETGHVEDADERGALTLGAIQGPVDPVHQPTEHPLVASLGDCLHRKLHLKPDNSCYFLGTLTITLLSMI